MSQIDQARLEREKKIMDYSTLMTSRAEHNLMIRSLRPIPEYGYTISEHERSKRRLALLLLRPILTALLHLVTK
jgi:hypothetical protein